MNDTQTTENLNNSELNDSNTSLKKSSYLRKGKGTQDMRNKQQQSKTRVSAHSLMSPGTNQAIRSNASTPETSGQKGNHSKSAKISGRNLNKGNLSNNGLVP